MSLKLDYEKIPKLPGCYIFKNKSGEIIYIGKSKSLRNRVRQYFNRTYPQQDKRFELVREINDIEITVTDTETNALILECQLIKKHKPRYNSQLKKSRVYPYIRINLKQDYPSIIITERIINDGCEYYGCFYNQDDAMHTLELINSIWQTPVCCKDNFSDKHRPCLNYHLKKCCAPCESKIDRDTYNQKITEIVKCLNGNFRNTLSRIKKDMRLASKDCNFERAAHFRDNIYGLNHLKKRQKRLYTTLENRDVYMLFRAFGENSFTLFFIRNGAVINRMDFPDVQTLDIEPLAVFIHNNMMGKIMIENGSFLASCLLEIGALKLFIPVSRKANDLKILKKLDNAINEFFSSF